MPGTEVERNTLDQDAKVPEKPTSLASSSRRKYARLPLCLPIRIARGNGSVINSSTENVSADGFYCYSLEALAPGERISGDFVILGGASGGGDGCAVRVNFEARVVRVDVTWRASGFGIACSGSYNSPRVLGRLS